jgi:hypothetical protein
MKCIYCGAELEKEDEYGYFCRHQSNEKLGDIFRCPNHEGFQTEADAREYNEEFLEDWEEACCESSCHSVSGCFYTDKYGELYKGYPC